MKATVRYLERLSRSFLLGWSLVLVLCLGVVDYLTGPDLPLTLLYLLPVGLVAWCAGRDFGVFTAVGSAVVSLLADLLVDAGASHPLLHCWNALTHAAVLAGVAILLSVLRGAREREEQLTGKDLLTGVDNRVAFLEHAGREIDLARRYGHPLTIICVDVDDFRGVNDRLGRHAGDVLLRRTAETIRGHVRESDTVARLGADEFAVLLPKAGYGPAKATAHRLRENLLRAMRTTGHAVTFSLAAVTFASPPLSVDEMLGQADDLMGSAKNSGKDTVMHAVWG